MLYVFFESFNSFKKYFHVSIVSILKLSSQTLAAAFPAYQTSESSNPMTSPVNHLASNRQTHQCLDANSIKSNKLKTCVNCGPTLQSLQNDMQFMDANLKSINMLLHNTVIPLLKYTASSQNQKFHCGKIHNFNV